MQRALLTAPVMLMAMALASLADDWPQWRGPGRDGVALGTKLPATLPAKLPEPRWRASVGEGYSSPVIAGERLFIMAREADGKEACLCFHAVTGEKLWRHAYPSSFKPPDPTAGRGPNATPTVDDDRVYMLGLGGMFHCLDAKDGNILWKHDFATEYWGVKKDDSGDDAWFPSCGAAASALVLDNLVIVPVGGSKAGAFTAFDRGTGKIKWKALDERSSYGSPMVAEMAGVRQIIGFTGLRMVGLRLSDQKLLWDYDFPAKFEQTVLTPVLANDLVIVGGEKKETVALRLKKDGDKVTQEVAWRNNDLQAYLSTPVVMGNLLIGLDARLKRLVALKLDTGETAWSYRGMSTYASLLVAGKRLLVLTSDGDLSVLSVTAKAAEEEQKWQLGTDGTWAHLAIVGNRLYVKDKKQVMCYEVSGK